MTQSPAYVREGENNTARPNNKLLNIVTLLGVIVDMKVGRETLASVIYTTPQLASRQVSQIISPFLINILCQLYRLGKDSAANVLAPHRTPAIPVA